MINKGRWAGRQTHTGEAGKVFKLKTDTVNKSHSYTLMQHPLPRSTERICKWSHSSVRPNVLHFLSRYPNLITNVLLCSQLERHSDKRQNGFVTERSTWYVLMSKE